MRNRRVELVMLQPHILKRIHYLEPVSSTQLGDIANCLLLIAGAYKIDQFS